MVDEKAGIRLTKLPDAQGNAGQVNMGKTVFFWIVLLGVLLAPGFLRAEAKYYRYSDDKQLYYTRGGRIYRYSDDKQLYYMRENRIYRYSDDKQLLYMRENRIYRYRDDKQIFYMKENRIYRYSDDKQLYYRKENRIYRYSDDKQILYYLGEDFKLTVFMVLMLVDM